MNEVDGVDSGKSTQEKQSRLKKGTPARAAYNAAVGVFPAQKVWEGDPDVWEKIAQAAIDVYVAQSSKPTPQTC